MPTGEDVLQMRSDNSGDTDENSDTLCNYCNTKVGKSVVKCIKCVGVFHLSCLMKAAYRKNTDCRHEMIPDKADDEYSLIKNENKFLKMEVTYLRALLEEANSKNLVLIENNKLLNEKISNIETNIKTSGKTMMRIPKQRKKPQVQTPTSKRHSHTVLCSRRGPDRRMTLKRHKSRRVKTSSSMSMSIIG